jgi:DNA-binding response OmpR family regulator
MVPTAGCDVLIVEDDPLVAEAIADSVRLAGYTVSGIAPTVGQALSLTRLTRPKLAVIDVDLGTGRDGIDLARQMLKVHELGIIFVTGNPDTVSTTDVGHAWMPKPYRVLDLINALEVVRCVNEHLPVTAPVPAELHLIGEAGQAGAERPV